MLKQFVGNSMRMHLGGRNIRWWSIHGVEDFNVGLVDNLAGTRQQGEWSMNL